MSYKVLSQDELRAQAPAGAPDANQELAAALNEMENDGWRLAGIVNGADPAFVFHFDDHKGRMGNMR